MTGIEIPKTDHWWHDGENMTVEQLRERVELAVATEDPAHSKRRGVEAVQAIDRKLYKGVAKIQTGNFNTDLSPDEVDALQALKFLVGTEVFEIGLPYVPQYPVSLDVLARSVNEWSVESLERMLEAIKDDKREGTEERVALIKEQLALREQGVLTTKQRRVERLATLLDIGPETAERLFPEIEEIVLRG